MGEDGVIVAITGAIVAVFLISAGFISFIVFFAKAKQKALIEKQERELEFLKTISEAEIEIRDETMNSISRELHDSVSQYLTVAKIHLGQVQKEISDKRLQESESVILTAMQEIRSLARSLNSDRLADTGLVEALQVEMERLDGLGGISAELTITGTSFDLAPPKKLVLFRIVQEFFNNSLKHAQANELKLDISVSGDVLVLEMSDNGVGFDHGSLENDRIGGLRNMRLRAGVIDARYNLKSAIGQGTMLTLTMSHE